MLFTNSIVLIDGSRERVSTKLETYRETIESGGFMISRFRTEYMESKCDNMRKKDNWTLISRGNENPQKTFPLPWIDCSYRSGYMSNRDINDITNIVAVDWLRWRSALRMLCDRLILIRSKGKLYKASIRPSMLFGFKYGMKKHVDRTNIAKMRMLR